MMIINLDNANLNNHIISLACLHITSIPLFDSTSAQTLKIDKIDFSLAKTIVFPGSKLKYLLFYMGSSQQAQQPLITSWVRKSYNLSAIDSSTTFKTSSDPMKPLPSATDTSSNISLLFWPWQTQLMAFTAPAAKNPPACD
jgi:hypothetical protein